MAYVAQAKEAARKALKTSAYYTSGTHMRPKTSHLSNFPAVRAQKTVEPALWVLTEETFETKLEEEYREVKPSESRFLVATTGIGKTTKLPLRLAAMSNKSGIVLIPDEWTVASVSKYVSSTVSASQYSNVTVQVLSSKFVKNPLPGPTVYYTYANDFLPRLHANLSMLKAMNVEFLYLDEAHVHTPAYYMLDILSSTSYLDTVKVFLGTATHPEVIRAEPPKRGSPPIAVPPNQCVIDSPKSMANSCPVHPTLLRGRTLIFLPTDHLLDVWHEYYDANDVSVMKVYSYSSSKMLDALDVFLKKKQVAVVLTSGRLEVGVTLSFDAVFCSGYKTEFKVDYTNASSELLVRPVTMAERIQRCGRVNRHIVGQAYYLDVKVSPPSYRLTDEDAIYVWMWCKLFNIHIKTEMIARYEELMSGYTCEAIASFLCSRVHPFLVIPYLNDEGELFAGWNILTNLFHTDFKIPVSEQDNEQSMSRWATYSTGPQDWVEEPTDYRASVKFPHEWCIIPAYAWMHFGSLERYDFDLDNFSVVSALVDARPTVERAKGKSVKASPKTVERSTSVMTRGPRHSTISLDNFPVERKSFDKQVLPPLPETRQESFEQLPYRSVRSVASSQKTAEIARWSEAAATSVKSPTKTVKRRSRSSTSSEEILDVDIRKVDPVKYKHHKLYPLDSALLVKFATRQTATDKDYSCYADLVNMKTAFASLSKYEDRNLEKRAAVFLSTIRVHNDALMNKLQAEASDYRQGPIAKLFGRRIHDFDAIVGDTARLLNAMNLESYFVGIDVRTKHTQIMSPRMGKFSKQRDAAQFFLLNTDASVSKRIKDLENAARPCLVDDKTVGTCWKFDTLLIAPHHIGFMESTDNTIMTLIESSEEADYVVYKTNEFCDTITFRLPADGEQVLFCGVDPIIGNFAILGMYTISLNSGWWNIDDQLVNGYSGFAVVSAHDGAVLGMYLGRSPYADAIGKCNVSMGHFVSFENFATAVYANA